MNDKKEKSLPPVVEQCDPGQDLEKKLREHPSDADAKVDVGSDESMDASDPSAAVQPGHDEPVPSSQSPKTERQDS